MCYAKWFSANVDYVRYLFTAVAAAADDGSDVVDDVVKTDDADWSNTVAISTAVSTLFSSLLTC